MRYSRQAFAWIALCSITSCAAGCAKQETNPLTIAGGETVAYRCEGGVRVAARYYSLSDKSLDFVKVTMSDGKEYTLPRVMSASGTRYTDDRELVWWSKGDTAMVERRTGEGDWKRVFARCVESGKK